MHFTISQKQWDSVVVYGFWGHMNAHEMWAIVSLSAFNLTWWGVIQTEATDFTPSVLTSDNRETWYWLLPHSLDFLLCRNVLLSLKVKHLTLHTLPTAINEQRWRNEALNNQKGFWREKKKRRWGGWCKGKTWKWGGGWTDGTGYAWLKGQDGRKLLWMGNGGNTMFCPHSSPHALFIPKTPSLRYVL